ncbi:hypothetical protein FF1_032498 [Malus domestica]
MAKLVLLIALCRLPALAAATCLMKTLFTVEGRSTMTLAALGTRAKPSPTLPVPRLDWNAETKATWHSCTPKKGQPTQQVAIRSRSQRTIWTSSVMQIQAATVLVSLYNENELRVEICFGIELVRLVPESVSLVMVNNEEKRIKYERLGFDWVGPQVGRGQTANRIHGRIYVVPRPLTELVPKHQHRRALIV